MQIRWRPPHQRGPEIPRNSAKTNYLNKQKILENYFNVSYPFELVQLEEDRRPSPVKSQLNSVQYQWSSGLSVEPSTVSPHQIGSVTHADVQWCPHWSKHPVRRSERGQVQTLIPASNLRPGQISVDPPANQRQRDGQDDFRNLTSHHFTGLNLEQRTTTLN